jgi:hypothetical protein
MSLGAHTAFVLITVKFVPPLKLSLKRRRICTWSDNKVRELIAVEVLHISLLNISVIAFKVLPLGSYAPMLAPSSLLLMSSMSSKCLLFNILFIFGNRKKVIGG